MKRPRGVGDRVQSWASILVGAVVIVGMAWLTLEQSTSARSRRDIADASTSVSVQNTSIDATVATTSVPEASAPVPLDEPDAGLGALLLTFDAALPTSGPRSVKVGIILVQWQGAENAQTSTRSKADALAKAQDLATLAKTDFRKAVAQGDPGSGEDLGRIPRGTLDPRIEGSLFALEAGSVSDVIETPRGYWIVKRNE